MASTKPEDEKFDLFLDFIYSDEWLNPINTFIEEYCLIFATNEPEEFKDEKNKVFESYRKMVASTLDNFLTQILGIQRKDLGALCKENMDELEYDDMVHFLALEDYNLFHTIMFEANKSMQRKAARRLAKQMKQQQSTQIIGRSEHRGDTRKPGSALTEEEMIEMAIARSQAEASGEPVEHVNSRRVMDQENMALKASMEAEKKRQSKLQNQKLTEEEELKQAMEESMRLDKQNTMDKKARDLDEEEQMMQAIMASQQEEMDRQMRVKDERRQALAKKKAELEAQAKSQKDALNQKYMTKEQQILAEEQARQDEINQKYGKQKESLEEEEKRIKAEYIEKERLAALTEEKKRAELLAAKKEMERKEEIRKQQLLEKLRVQAEEEERRAKQEEADAIARYNMLETPEEKAARDAAQAEFMRKKADAAKDKGGYLSNMMVEEVKKEDQPAQGDVFRSTGISFNESKANKDARFGRAFDVLSGMGSDPSKPKEKQVASNAVMKNLTFNKIEEEDEEIQVNTGSKRAPIEDEFF